MQDETYQPANTVPDLLEICLDLLTPATLGALWHDHTNYIAQHQDADGNERWRDLDLLQQDADLIHAHLTEVHFKGEAKAAQQYLDGITHIPF